MFFEYPLNGDIAIILIKGDYYEQNYYRRND